MDNLLLGGLLQGQSDLPQDLQRLRNGQAIGALGEPLLTALYGRAFAGYGVFVMASAAIMIVFLIRDFLAIMVKTIEKTDFDFYASLLGTAVTFVLLYPLVRRFGLAGALTTEALMQVAMLGMIALGLSGQWRSSGRKD